VTGIVLVAASHKMGGGNRVLTDLASGLDRRRFSPVLLSPRPGPLVDWATQMRIPVRVMPGGKRGGRLELLGQTAAIVAAVRRAHAPIIHAAAHTCYRPVGLAGLLTGAVRICHLGFPPGGQEIEYFLRFGAEVVVGCYHGQVDEVADMVARVSPRSRLVGIPNGVDTTKYSPLAEVTPTAAAPFRFGADHVVLIVGHLSEVKGYPEFFRAAAQVTLHVDNVAFVALGEETVSEGYRAHLTRLVDDLGIAPRVHFLGWRGDVADVLRAADVMVLPSRAEGLPLAILEAMACGKPVVATRVNGVPEAVIDGRTGILVEPGDDKAIAGALVRLLDQPEVAKRMGAEGRRFVERSFSLDRFVRQVEDLYDEVHTLPTPGWGAVMGMRRA
jgi:glycosyltransferase involved in cell wall biosynthesis